MIEVNNAEELNVILEKTEKVLVLFYATWCPYCVNFVPIFDKKIINYNVGNVIHVLLDDYDNQIWDDFDIEAVPTVISFEKGKVDKRLDGRFGLGLNERQLNVWLENFKLSS
jgi:thioredoxin-like negative regulator of GroEL